LLLALQVPVSTMSQPPAEQRVTLPVES